MDGISSSSITASSILRTSQKTEQVDSKAVETNDSFVKSSETDMDKKMDFVKKSKNMSKGKKKFVKSTLTGTAIGAGAGAVLGAGLGAATAMHRALEKIPESTHSVEYQLPDGTQQTFAGQIPTDYYVSGNDAIKSTPLKNAYFTNPATDANGKPIMKDTVLTSTGKGTPSVTWKTKDIDFQKPTMEYNEWVSEDFHYVKEFSHYDTKWVQVLDYYRTETREIYAGTDDDGYSYYTTETVSTPVYKTVPEQYPVYKDVKVHDGYNHRFSADYESKTLGTYDVPSINWNTNLDAAALRIKGAAIGAGIGAACGAVAGALVSGIMNYDYLLEDIKSK